MAALRELGADESAIIKAGYEAGKLLLNAARPLVPVRTGNLVGSLSQVRNRNNYAVRILKSRAPYANPIHWGWKVVGAQHQGYWFPGHYIGIKAQPFFSEALGYNYDEIRNKYEVSMNQLIDSLERKK